MKSVLIVFTLLFSLQGCGQNNKAMDEKVTEILGNLYRDVKHSEQEVSYRAIYFIGGCSFELLINDFPIMHYYGPGDGSLSESVPINNAIIKSGLQTWKIRVYPVHIDRVPQQTISDGARVELKIQAIRFKDNGDIAERKEPILVFEAPLNKDSKTGKNIFADAGKPYIEPKLRDRKKTLNSSLKS